MEVKGDGSRHVRQGECKWQQEIRLFYGTGQFNQIKGIQHKGSGSRGATSTASNQLFMCSFETMFWMKSSNNFTKLRD